jgi:hypothetical protein
MPSKCQKPLPFQRTVIQCSTQSTATASNPPMALYTPVPSDISLAPSATSTPIPNPLLRP